MISIFFSDLSVEVTEEELAFTVSVTHIYSDQSVHSNLIIKSIQFNENKQHCIFFYRKWMHFDVVFNFWKIKKKTGNTGKHWYFTTIFGCRLKIFCPTSEGHLAFGLECLSSVSEKWLNCSFFYVGQPGIKEPNPNLQMIRLKYDIQLKYGINPDRDQSILVLYIALIMSVFFYMRVYSSFMINVCNHSQFCW